MALLKDPVMGDDPEGPKVPCEYDVSAAKRDLRSSFDDIMFTHDLEWADGVSVASAAKQINDLVDRLVAPAGGCRSICPR